MAEYIERTEELILAVNAGARAIEQSRRFCGATYVRDVFSDHPQEIQYVTAAKVLRDVDALPAADVVEVVRCKDCIYQRNAWHRDGRMKAGGVWLYGCKLNEDQFVSHVVNGEDDECRPHQSYERRGVGMGADDVAL